MLPSGKFPWIAAGVTLAIALLLLANIGAAPTASQGVLFANILDFAMVLWGAACCVYAARRSGNYLRHLWSLLAAGLFLESGAQLLTTYYQRFENLPLNPWPSDVLFFIWPLPVFVTFLPQAEGKPGEINWQRVLDYAQVGIVTLTAYLYFFYIPSKWEQQGTHLEAQILSLYIVRDLGLAICFVVRGRNTTSRAVGVFSRAMVLVFAASAVSHLSALLILSRPWMEGQWKDALWALPYAIVAVFAVSWQQGEDQTEAPPSRFSDFVMSHVLPIGLPLVVIFMGRRIAQEQVMIAMLAVTASFLCSAVRLILTNHRLVRIGNELRESEQRFRTLVEELHVGVVLQTADARIEYANRAALSIFGFRPEQVLGKRVADLGITVTDESQNEIPMTEMPVIKVLSSGQPVRSSLFACQTPERTETLWIFGNTIPQLDEKGRVFRVITTFADITDFKNAEKALHQLSTQLLQMQDQERRRIGRELHDGLAQTVLAVNLNLAQVRESTALGARSERALEKARSLLQDMSREIRTLSYLLHPPLLDDLGLVSALKEYVHGFGERSGIQTDVALETGFERLPQNVETTFFRIVQESLANVQRHSGSATARICLREEGRGICLEVSDQGRGISQATNGNNNRGKEVRLGVGIPGMRERMAQLGGTLEVVSGPQGTTVRARWDRSTRRAERETESAGAPNSDRG